MDAFPSIDHWCVGDMVDRESERGHEQVRWERWEFPTFLALINVMLINRGGTVGILAGTTLFARSVDASYC